MKNILSIFVRLLFVAPAFAQVVVERGPHTDVVQVLQQNDRGENVPIAQYTILQPGLNYFSSEEGIWKPTSTQIDLEQGGAAYRKGPFKLNFAANVNDPVAAVALTLPDGRTIKIKTLGIALTATNGDSVWLGEIKNSNGLLDGDTVVFPDAFSGVKADIVVKVSVGKYESDVVLREQVISPQLVGFDANTATLEIWHKVVEAPAPEVAIGHIPRKNGSVDEDQQLGFGDMFIGEGAAFLVGTNKVPVSAPEGAIRVAKERFNDAGTQYLIEKIPYAEAAAQLQSLPAREEARLDRDLLKQRILKARNVASRASRNSSRSVPVSLAESGPSATDKASDKKVAAITRGTGLESRGFVMDYSVLVGATDFRFRGDTTYYCTNAVSITGNAVIEGGTVVKFPPYNGVSRINFYGKVDCQTSPYSMAVFTADADNSIGEVISTNALSGYYGRMNLCFISTNPNAQNIHDIRTCYAYWGIELYSTGAAAHDLSNIQLMNCWYGIEGDDPSSGTCYVNARNILADGTVVPFYGSRVSYAAEHVTAHNANHFFTYVPGSSGALTLTNSLLVNIASSSSAFSADHVTTLSSDAGVFTTVGAGAHYLPVNSPYRNAGTTGVSPEMKAILKTTTTDPPQLITDAISKSTTLAPRAFVDSGLPDLGYHFARLDYLWTDLMVTDATLTLTNGVAVGWYGNDGIFLAKDSKLISEGKPNAMNEIVRYSLVQEQSAIVGVNSGSACSLLQTTNDLSVANRPEVQMRFTEIAMPGQISFKRNFFTGPNNATGAKSILIENSHFRNVSFSYTGMQETTTAHSISLINSVFERCSVGLDRYYGPQLVYNILNNLFTYGSVSFSEGPLTSIPTSYVRDNVFDTITTSISGNGTRLSHDHNAYYASATLLYPMGMSGVNVQLTEVNYVSSYFGRYYSPGTGGLSALINAGSRAANSAKLYHFTSLASQTKELNSTVDIGVHYLACNADGTIVDTDHDGLWDIVEDANLDGVVAVNETSFLNADTDGDGVTDGGEKRAGTDPLVASTGPRSNKRLGYWSFDDPDFNADTGELCLDHTGGTSGGITSVSFAGSAAHMTLNGSRLVYPEIGDDGYPTLDRSKGTVRFWFRPDWTISQMPTIGRLVSVGTDSVAKGNFWTVDLVPNAQPATAVRFIFKTQLGGVETTLATADLSDWTTVKWHQITLTYEGTNIVLYVDGANKAQATNATPWILGPSFDKRIFERIAFGSAKDGSATARGHIDEIETFNYPMTSDEIIFDYAAMAARDDDHDGLSNLTEVDIVGTNPAEADTDHDQMPDGWEYWWNIWKRQTSFPSFNLTDTNVHDADMQFEAAGNQDSFTNLQEYRLGLNPYFKDAPPVPTMKNTALGADKLINIKFGTTSATGKAGAGFADDDQWNVVGPLASGRSLNWANGGASSATISLRMQLGHVTKFTVNCDTVTEEAQAGKYYCDWLSQTNVWQNIFCCTNMMDSADPAFATSQAQFLCIHSQTGERMYLKDDWWGPPSPIQTLPDQHLYRALLPTWPWTPAPPLFLKPVEYDGDGAYYPTTTARTLVLSDRMFQRNGATAPTGDGSGVAGTHVLSKIVRSSSMESAYVDGFDQMGAFVNGAGVSGNPFFSEYLWNGMDGQLVAQPQSTACNSYWFVGDGHGSIVIENLPLRTYMVYLYAARPGVSSSTPVSVNGVHANIPAFGANLQKFVEGVNFIAVGTGPTSTITIDYSNNESLINAIQILERPSTRSGLVTPTPAPTATAAYDDADGIRVDWTALPGVAYRVYRVAIDPTTLLPAIPLMLAQNTDYCALQDIRFPRTQKIQYRIAICDPWTGIEIGAIESNILDPQPSTAWNGKNQAPTLNYVDTLRHTYKDTPFAVSAGKIQLASDAFDFEGTPLAFDVTEVVSGTLVVDNGSGPSSYSPSSGVLNPPVRIGWDTSATWTPPGGMSETNVPAFKIRASDGAFESITDALVRVEVRDTSVLMWWGQSIWGLCGTGETALWRSHDIEQWWGRTPDEERYTIEPAVLQLAPDPMTAGADRRLTNVVQLAVGNMDQQTRAALCADGTVWTWGVGRYGMLGNGYSRAPEGDSENLMPRYMTQEAKWPIRASISGVQAIAAGTSHMLALKADGTVWGWGMGEEGQMGTAPENLPLMATHIYKLSDGNPDAARMTSTPRRIPGLQNIVAIAAGGQSSLAVNGSGEVYWWGSWSATDHFEKSFWPVRIEVPGRVVQAVVDGDSFMALNSEGEVYSWGAGELRVFLQSPAQNAAYAITPLKAPLANVRFIAGRTSHRVAVLSDGSVVQWGVLPVEGWVDSPQVVRGLRKIVKVKTSGTAALAIDEAQNVYGWGQAGFGVLGQRISLSEADQKFLSSSPQTDQERAERRVYFLTPKFGFYKYPVQLDALEWVEDVAIGFDAGFAVAPVRSLSPRGLAAQSGDSQAIVSWKRFPQATSYELQRKSSRSGWTTIASLPDNTLLPRQTWTDIGLENQNVYWYRVRAFVAGAPTEYCVEVEAWPDLTPLQVTGVAVEAQSRRVHLYWEALAGKVDYEVWRKVGTAPEFTYMSTFSIPPVVTVHPNCGETALNNMVEIYDPELSAGVTYQYKVRAGNDIGYGEFSDVVSTSGITADTTGAPTSVTVTTAQTEITLAWTTPDGLEEKSQYIVRVADWVRQNGTSFTLQKGLDRVVNKVEAGEAGTTHTVNLPAEPGRKYTISLSVVSPCIGERAAAIWEETTAPYVGPSLDNLVTQGSAGALYARWHGSAKNYMVSLTKSGVNALECTLPIVITPDENGFAEFYQAGLSSGDYVFTIDQFYDGGGGYPGNRVTQTIHVNPAPALIDCLPISVTAANNRLSIIWWGDEAHRIENIASHLGWRFILERQGPEQTGCPAWVTVYDGPDMGVDDREVKNGSQYKYRVLGIDPALNIVTTPIPVPPATYASYTPGPSFGLNPSLTLTATPRNGAVELSWNAVGAGVTAADEYELQGSPVAGGPHPILAVISKDEPLNYVDRNVVNGVSYYYEVVARKINGDSVPSTEVSATPQRTDTLLAPYGIVAEVVAGNIVLQWLESPGAEYYTVAHNGGTGLDTKSPGFTVALSATLQHNFTVVAHARGASSAPGYFTFLTWGPPNCVSCTVTQYRVYKDGVSTDQTVGSLVYSWSDHPLSSIFASFTVSAELSGQAPVSAGPAVNTALTSGLFTIELGPLPASVVSPTNLVVSASVKIASRNDPANRVEFYVDDSLVETVRTPPYQFTWVNPSKSVSGHRVKARVIDPDGNVVSTPEKVITVNVIPELQAFQTSSTDLQIPAPGMPLTVSRSYDSRNLSVGMLGTGWKFDWERAGMSVPDLGIGWAYLFTGNILVKRTLEEAPIHVIEVRLPNGAIQRFHPSSGAVGLFPDFDDNSDRDTGDGITSEYGHNIDLFFDPMPGYSGRLQEALGPTTVFIPANMAWTRLQRDEDSYFIAGQDGAASIRGFAYVDDDGTQYWFKGADLSEPGAADLKLVAVTNRYGVKISRADVSNSEDFSLGHSNGKTVWFKKTGTSTDYYWNIYDPIGTAANLPAVKYHVVNSLLTEMHVATDRSAAPGTYAITRYQYSNNLLIRVIRPDGVIVLENEYSQNLLSAQRDAMGLRKSLQAVTTSDGSIPLDVTDNVPAGSAAAMDVPRANCGPGGELNGVTQGSADSQVGYDSLGRPSFQATKVNATDYAYTSYEYDSKNRIRSVTDALGNQSFATYTKGGDPESVYDAKGLPTRYDYYETPVAALPTDPNIEYNPEGALRSVTDALGNQTIYTYNMWGQVLTEKHVPAEGGVAPVTSYLYDSAGNVLEVREPLWTTGSDFYKAAYTYDDNGNRQTETRKRQVIARNADGTAQMLNGNPVMTTETITTQFTYDPQNRLIKTQNAISDWSGSLYDANGKVIQSTNSLGQVTSYTYDPRGNLIETKYPDNTVSRSIYDERGRVIWTQERCTSGTDTMGPATQTVYDTQGRVHFTRRYVSTYFRIAAMSSLTEADAFPDSYLNERFRRLSSLAAPTLYTMTLNDAGTLLSSVRTEYDVAGRVLYSVDEAGGLTEFGYDGLGRRTSVKRYVSYIVPAPIETSTIAPPGNATASVTSYGYDESGNQVSATDGNGCATSYEYDRLNRQRVVIYPAVGGAERKRTVTDYDGLGRRVMEWDEAGIATAFGYDALGRLTSVTNDFQAVDTEQEKNTPAATHYAYDEVGNMTKEVRLTYTVDTDGYLYHLPQGLEENVGRTTIYEYDKLGRRVRRFLPGASLDDVSSNSGLEKVTYTELGSGAKTLRKDVRDFRGKTIGYSYDAMDRLVTKSLPQVTSGVDVARTVSYSYTGGLLTQVSETGSGVARTNYYAYDTASRLRKKDTPEGVLTYTYNARGQVERTKGFRRATVTVNMEVGGAVPEVDVEYGYDALGRLATVKDWKQGGANVSTNYYDLAGVLTKTSYPNTIRQRFDHTEQNRLSKVTWEQNTGTAMVAKKRFAYGLNATGQRVQVDEDDGAPAVSRTVKYAYDSALTRPVIGMGATATESGGVNLPFYQRIPKLGRLTQESVIYPNTSAQNADYTYDLVGNRLTRANATAIDSALTNQALDYDTKDRFTQSGAPVSFDANGNSVSSASGTVTDWYDAENRLVKRTAPNSVTIRMVYDHEGNRVGKQVQTGSSYLNTYYLVDDKNPTGYAQVLFECRDLTATPNPLNGSLYLAYAYGQNLISIRHSFGTTYYYGYDGQGSVRALFNSAGTIAKTYNYDAWGNWLAPNTEPIDNHYRYTGQQYDIDLGLYYLRARYYSPQYGRFWTMDAFEGSQFQPVDLHKFNYCGGDPVNRVDPSGEFFNMVSLTSGSGMAIGLAGISAAGVIEAKTHALANLMIATGQAGAEFLDPNSVAAPNTTVDAEVAVAAEYHSMKDLIDKAKEVLKQLGKLIKNVKVVPVPRRIIPDIAYNVSSAQSAGHPIVLTRVTQTQAKKNRRDALKGRGSAGWMKSWDEYPFASGKLPGTPPAQVMAVPMMQNWIQGGIISACYRLEPINVGQSYFVIVIP